MTEFKLDHLYFFADTKRDRYIIRILSGYVMRYYNIKTGLVSDMPISVKNFDFICGNQCVREPTKRERARALLVGL